MSERRPFALSLTVELGWCGLGLSGGLFPEIRLGLVRVWCCGGSAAERLRWLEGLYAKVRERVAAPWADRH